MTQNKASLRETLIKWMSFLRLSGRAAVAMPLFNESDLAAAKQHIDPDFERWVAGDPMVTRNPANRYGELSRGYITGNGLGSLEVGAADD